MSCSCSCCRELLEGAESRKERGGDPLLPEEEKRRKMDVSVLREEYRRSRETQRRQTHLILFRTVSEDLSEAVNIVPVPQALASSRESDGDSAALSPPDVSLEPDPVTYDPWHIHLGLHRRSHHGVSGCPAMSPEMMDASVCSPSRFLSSEVSGSTDGKVSADPTVDSPGEMSPCSKDQSGRDADPSSSERPGPESISAPSDPPELEGLQASVLGPLSGSFSSSKGSSESSSFSESSAAVHLISSDRDSAPGGSTSDLNAEFEQNSDRHSDGSPTCRQSTKFSGPVPRLTRQLSVGAVGSPAAAGSPAGSPAGVHHNQSFFPFPHRKSPRISEAAKRLGLYSSF